MMTVLSHKNFQVPEYLNASVPAEYRGLTRDGVNLMVIDSNSGNTHHNSFHEIGSYLEPGDVLVLNNSRTIPSVLKGRQDGMEVEVRLSRSISDHEWDVLVVQQDADLSKPIYFEDGIEGSVVGSGSEFPLVTMSFSVGGSELFDFFYRYGKPIRYEYIENPWPLQAFQTVYGSVPGSVEMPSAGRAFSWKILNQLREEGIELAFIQLHAGLSYYGNDLWPNPDGHPEAYEIPEETARLVNEAKERGGKVIAVGTTVVRTLETAADENGNIEAGKGITNLYIKKGTNLKAVDGLLTGFHEPEASHLDMLTAFLPEDILMAAYQEALEHGYLWHEFGDMNLILPLGGKA
ncbi:S-adenosylmethionine:tRNA ribosyltransferase-isomerase [Falsibacillus pallidus]|uniref:S-adenosylmethionine--tRNA ribosyltransferase-isomerase n=1 Tax=Falsibacillus pallidus TaxID=493781 RepID=A0A370GF72_9BACI|nr:S-adenosylmethionine:tRNA ribosyltransferase-isomerase [Falsibacillus pallidus]RDI42311.1 S-adenosylmethionine--tRNA ribosyltransferase-isomerase [Falsibacillus pallidus]